MSRSVLALSALIVLVAVVARLLPGPRTIDDAFITFRYSRNLAEGRGFVYNEGVHTLGTTTPLFTLLMAAISMVTGRPDYPNYAIAVSALADAFTAVLLYRLARRLIPSEFIPALPGFLWAVSPRSVTFAIGGMETSVNILWMVAATSVFVTEGANHRSSGASVADPPSRHRWLNRGVLVGLFAGLGLLTRIDAALWIAPLFLYQLVVYWRNGQARGTPVVSRLPWATWIACGMTVLPWLAFSTWYFGSPLPNSLAAKSVAYVLPPGAALATFITTYSTPFFEFDTFGPVGAMLGGVIYLTLSLFAIAYVARREPRLLPFLIYPWLYLLVFAVANPLIFRWYLAPPMPALFLGIVIGAWSLVRHLQGRQTGRQAASVAMGLVGILWLGMSLHAWRLLPDHGPNRPAPAMAWHAIELLYQQVGTRLRDEYGVTPRTLVASADIGAVGYFSEATIVDTVGLITPELRRYYPAPPDIIAPGQNYAIPPQLILDTRPEYLVTMEGFVREGLERNEAFKAGYELLFEIPTDYYGTGMRVYRRSG